MFKFLGGLVSGATYPLRAIALLCQNRQWQHYILIPVILNFFLGVTLYLGLLVLGVQGIDAVILNLSLPSWANGGITLPILEWLLRIILGILLLLTTGFLLGQFGVILGAPWYGKLSEQLELQRLGQLPPEEPAMAGGIFRNVQRSLLYESKKLVLLITLGIPLFAISFLPPIGSLIGSIGGISLSATLLCLDLFDAPLERRRLSFQDKLQVIRHNLPASATFALVSLLLVSIPILNLVTIPLCVTAGTLFFCDRIYPRLDTVKLDKKD
jgi:CysZ protein